MNLTNSDLKKLYRDMWDIRLFEDRLASLFKKAIIPGSVHLGIGQEACMAGTCFNLEDGDTIGATHREHGVLLCRGSDPNAVMAELLGRATGLCKGKGGSMHTCDLGKGCLGNNAILGPGQTIINGYAYANKKRENKKVAVSMFGEGASNRGEFHEGLNFASLWNLPTIYILQNNRYALSLPKDQQQRIEDLSIRAQGYGMPGVRVDGQDVLAVVEASAEAIKRARGNGGPTLLVYETYRYKGHFEGDPTPYRTKDELEDQMNNNDPIKRFERVLLERDVMTEKEMLEVQAESTAMVDAAEKFAMDSPFPDPSEIYSDVYFYEEGRA